MRRACKELSISGVEHLQCSLDHREHGSRVGGGCFSGWILRRQQGREATGEEEFVEVQRKPCGSGHFSPPRVAAWQLSGQPRLPGRVRKQRARRRGSDVKLSSCQEATVSMYLLTHIMAERRGRKASTASWESCSAAISLAFPA